MKAATSFVYRDSMLIFLLAVPLFTIGLIPEFQGLNARFALFAQEMLRNGPTFFPTTYGEPYPDYPGTATFFIYLASLPFGRVTLFSAVLPTAVVSALILVVIYRIGAIRSRQWGLWAVLLGIFTKGFFSGSRDITPDQFVSLVTVLCFYLIYSGTLYDSKRRLWLVPLLMFTGFAFRGPIGLVIPAGVVCGYYLLNKDFKTLVFMGVAALVMLSVGLAALLAGAYVQGGETFVEKVIHMQVSGRMPTASHGYGYYWFAGLAKYAVSYPLAVMVLLSRFGDIRKPKTDNDKLLGHLALWILIIMIGMSIPGVKKMRYILPALPAFALMGSYIFVDPSIKGFLLKVRNGFLKFCNGVPYIAGVFCLAVLLFRKSLVPSFGVYAVSAFLSMSILITILRLLPRRVKNDSTRDMGTLLVATLTFCTLVICFSEPIAYVHFRSKPFVDKVSAFLERESAPLVFYKIHPDSEAIKFMVNYGKPFMPEFIVDPEEILAIQSPAYFISREENFKELPQGILNRIHVLHREKMDSDDCVLFTRQEEMGPQSNTVSGHQVLRDGNSDNNISPLL